MEKSVHLASVYQKLGWNMHKQGLNAEAIQYVIATFYHRYLSILLIKECSL